MNMNMFRLLLVGFFVSMMITLSFSGAYAEDEIAIVAATGALYNISDLTVSTTPYQHFVSYPDGGTYSATYLAQPWAAWSGAFPGDLDTGDVDKDGYNELVYIIADGRICMRDNNAMWDSSQEPVFLVGWQAGRPIALGDFDGDGQDEIATTVDFGGGYNYLVTIDFTTCPPTAGNYTVNYLYWAWGAYDLAAGDFDKDGYDELTYVCPGGYWFKRDHDKMYTWGESTYLGGFSDGSRLAAGDFDNDDYDEVATVGNIWGGAMYYYNLTMSPTDTAGASYRGAGLGFPVNIAGGDFDGDGADEIATVDARGILSIMNDNGVWTYYVLGFSAGSPIAAGDFVKNQAPIADAGLDQIVEATSPTGAFVTLDGSGSSDPDGNPLTYSWSVGGIEVATGVQPTPIELPLGTTTITLVVNDGVVDSDPNTMDITVEDTTLPVLEVSVIDPAVLWPPNHKMVDAIAYTVSDIADSNPTVDIDVIVDDVEGGAGDPGNVDFDTSVAGVVSLRAERSGKGTGRIYDVVITATDASTNSTGSGSIKILVPHDLRKKYKK